MRNYTIDRDIVEDVVVVGRKVKSKRQMPKLWRKTKRIPLDSSGRRVMVDVWIAKPTAQKPYPTIFLALGFAKGYVLIPFRTPAELDGFVSEFVAFMNEVFAAENPREDGVIEAWDEAIEEARAIVAAYYDNDSTTHDSTTPLN